VSATTSGAIKAALEAAGLGVPWYRDVAPDTQQPPFGTVQESIGLDVEASGDEGDPQAHVSVAELVQVDLWQAWKTANGRPAESYDLPSRTVRALRAASLPTPQVTYGLTGTWSGMPMSSTTPSRRR
jgi:hypothetical protein